MSVHRLFNIATDPKKTLMKKHKYVYCIYICIYNAPHLHTYVLCSAAKPSVYKYKKHFKNEQRSRDAAAQKELMQVE